jgi:hypothetical protein
MLYNSDSMWCQRNTSFQDNHMLGTTAFGGGGVTVSGCFSFDCKLDLYVLDGNLTGQKYRDNVHQWTRLHVRIVHPKWSCDQSNRAWRWCNVNCERFMSRRTRIPWWRRRLITVRVLSYHEVHQLYYGSTGLMKVVYCYALQTVVQGFGANETLHFRTTTFWAQLPLVVGV